ncbi:MAG: hypothetical protein J6W28_05320 [Clostridia bacterium]|nr:hypothetical protein [Clostridia bacterium]
MTGNELYQTVAQMGFSRTLEDGEDYFFRAVNLSLARIARQFPILASYDVRVTAGNAYYTPLAVGEEREDFLSFPSHPLSKDGRPLREGRDYLVQNGTLRIAREACGELTVRYLHRPTPLTRDSMEEALDLLPMAEGLLPLLVASYLWLDDRGDLATHYLSLYRAEAEELRACLYRHGGAAVTCGNGWDKTE